MLPIATVARRAMPLGWPMPNRHILRLTRRLLLAGSAYPQTNVQKHGLGFAAPCVDWPTRSTGTLTAGLVGSHIAAPWSEVGFLPSGEGWPSCYAHPTLRLFLVLHVDDFKLAGPRKNLAEGWRLLRQRLPIEDAKPIGLYLGCCHNVSKSRHIAGAAILVMQYSMEGFLKTCVERYQEFAGGDARLYTVRTPLA